MVEPTSGFHVVFTDPGLQPAATSIVDELQATGTNVAPPELKRPSDATLGTPEIIITIIITAAAKAVIVTGIRAIQRVLEQHLDDKTEKRAQVVLQTADGQKEKFPISLKGLGKEALHEFMNDIIGVVGKM